MIDDAFSGKKAAQQVKLTDENTGIQYLLKPGRNTLGRKADISIEEDLFLSRIHCMIELIERNGVTEAILSDDGKGSPSGEPSKNGTCYNGELLTIYDQIMLNDGDHIKIGHTELGVTFN